MKKDEKDRKMLQKIHRVLREIQTEDQVTILPSLKASACYILECSQEQFSLLN